LDLINKLLIIINMACNHRFQQELTAHNYPLNYLFLGTFNPEWNSRNNNASWFYCRSSNDLWYILPKIIDGTNLMQERDNVQLLKEWSIFNSIGFTDLISHIENADELNNDHVRKILSFKDNYLEKFDLVATDIDFLIRKNADTLRKGGVYLTRFEHTMKTNGKIFMLWKKIKNICEELSIPCNCLVTPSRGYRKITRDQKAIIWQQIIRLEN